MARQIMKIQVRERGFAADDLLQCSLDSERQPTPQELVTEWYSRALSLRVECTTAGSLRTFAQLHEQVMYLWPGATVQVSTVHKFTQ